MNWHYDLLSVASPIDAAGHFDERAFASPFRSTVPLIDLARSDPDRLAAIALRCGADVGASAHLEYCAANPAGGRPSQTDLMLLGATRALAIEAKWTEPRYPTVASRLKERASSSEPEDARHDPLRNEQKVSGWLELLQPHARTTLALAQASALVYQMVHRAASACSTGLKPALTYVHFETSDPRAAHAEQYVADLRALHEFMGRPADFPMTVVELPLSPTAQFREIAGLRKGLPETHEAVRRALADAPLFSFGEPQFTRIE